MLEYDPALSVERARQIITETAITDAATGTIPPLSNIWGAGRVNALGAVDRLINGTGTRPHIDPVPAYPAVSGLICISGNRLKLAGGTAGASIELFNTAGRLVLRQAGNVPVRLSRLPQGLYLARALDKGKAVAAIKVSVVR
jgi:hypothetical protein